MLLRKDPHLFNTLNLVVVGISKHVHPCQVSADVDLFKQTPYRDTFYKTLATVNVYHLTPGRQDDTKQFVGIDAAAAGGNGSVVMAGEAEAAAQDGTWDATAVKLDVNGNEVWTWQVKLKTFPCFH